MAAKRHRVKLSTAQIERRIRLLQQEVELKKRKALALGANLDDLDDIQVDSPRIGDHLQWDGASYIVESIAADGITLMRIGIVELDRERERWRPFR